MDGSGPSAGPPPTLPGLVVSTPVQLSAVQGRARVSAASPASAGVAYVSLAPGSVPDGRQATITNLATTQSVMTVVVDGGFDPVAIPASIGDTLQVNITRFAGSAAVRGVDVVRALRPPVVVRTSPPKGGHDVPLNASVVIVVSEPLDSATMTTGTVTLWRGTTPVPGTVRFADAAHLRVEFHPDTLLAGQTDYQLVLSQGIRDVNGLALDSTVAVPFTTGTTAPSTGLVFASVSASWLHTCGVTTSGAAYCWGAGNLGDGSTGGSTTPVPVAGGLTFATISTGQTKTCGVTIEGELYCWGPGNRDYVDAPGSTTPVRIPLGLPPGPKVASVSVGTSHRCAVMTTGAAYCWGQGPTGELGSGPDIQDGSIVPVAVAGGLSFASVSAGERETCGVTTSGTAFCWGNNVYGALGTGSSTGPELCVNYQGDACSTVPVAVSGGLVFAQVVAKTYAACGITTSGSVFCWGSNLGDQLALGTRTGPEECVDAFATIWACSRTPIAVRGASNWVTLSGRSGEGTCGVTSTGVGYCWGYHSQLVPDTSSVNSPVAVPGGLTFGSISAGGWHACGVTTAGAAYCWGANDYGELGDGTTSYSDVPVKVAGQP